MARRYINQLTAGERVDEIYMVVQKQLRTTANGSYYIHCVLGDKTGSVQGRVWQASDSMYDAFPLDGFARVRGRAESYQGNLQLVIEGMQPVSSERVDMREFLPHTERDIEEMWQRVVES